MTPEIPVWGDLGMLCLAIAGALLQSERRQRMAGGGLLLLALALAGWQAGAAPHAGLTPPSRLGTGFLVGNGGLFLLGSGLVAAAAWRTAPGATNALARVLTAGGVLLLVPVIVGFVGAGGPARALGAAVALGVTGSAGAIGVRAVLRSRVGTIARRVVPPPLSVESRSPRPGRKGVALLLVAVAAAALAPHVALVFAGTIGAVWAGYLLFHIRGERLLPVAPVLTLLLVPAYVLLATVAGPVGLRTDALPQIPLSPAAELLVSPLLLLAGWAATGLWPLQRQIPGALLAPAGGLLLWRIALPAAPEGLEYWRPLTVPLVMFGLWSAAGYGRWALVAAGAGFLVLAEGAPAGRAPAAWLLAVGLALELAAFPHIPARIAGAIRAVAWPPATVAGIGMLEAGLRSEVVYTALGALGLAIVVTALIPPRAGSILPTETR